jgi:hypothetical protein
VQQREQGGWGSSTVLDRPAQQEEAGPHEFVEVTAYEVEEDMGGKDLAWEREFSDYAAATEMMNELESLQAELQQRDRAMDSMWLAPETPASPPPRPPTVAPNSEVSVCAVCVRDGLPVDCGGGTGHVLTLPSLPQPQLHKTQDTHATLSHAGRREAPRLPPGLAGSPQDGAGQQQQYQWTWRGGGFVFFVSCTQLSKQSANPFPSLPPR